MKLNFFEQKKEEPKPETKEGFKPVSACIVDIKSVDDLAINRGIVDKENIDNLTREIIKSIEENGTKIDYYGDEEFFQKHNIKNVGKMIYAISESDYKDKYSENYHNCTGIIVVGKDKNGQEISFMTHQNPTKILADSKNKDKFTADLSKSTDEILSKVEKDSIDVVMFGGNYMDFSQYKKLTTIISDISKEKFGLEPTIIVGPNYTKIEGEGDMDTTNIYFDTQNRRLYIVRPEQKNNKLNYNYLPSDLKNIRKPWNKKL